MGGHGFYIWGSYGMLLAAVVIEIALLRRRRRLAKDAVGMAQEEIDE